MEESAKRQIMEMVTFVGVWQMLSVTGSIVVKLLGFVWVSDRHSALFCLTDTYIPVIGTKAQLRARL